MRTSPRLQPAAAHTHGGASSQVLPFGATTESMRGGGTNINTAPTPASRMPFDSVGWETPIGTYSVSFISHSTKSPSRRFDVATTYPLAAKRAKRRPNATEGKGSFCSVDDADDGGDKYDSNDDIIPAATDCSILTTAQDAAAELFIAEKSAELIEKHHQEFIKRAFSVRALAADVSLTTVSASIKMCRLQRRTLTISSMSSRIGVWV